MWRRGRVPNGANLVLDLMLLSLPKIPTKLATRRYHRLNMTGNRPDPEKIYKSPLPDVELPRLSLSEFLFDNSPLTQQNPSKSAFIDGVSGASIKFGELKSLTYQIAYGLRHKMGLKERDTILIFSVNSIWYPLLLWGAQMADITPTMASSSYQAQEL